MAWLPRNRKQTYQVDAMPNMASDVGMPSTHIVYLILPGCFTGAERVT